jgi:hypothetical protein
MKGLLIVMEREIVKQELKEIKPYRTGLSRPFAGTFPCPGNNRNT